MKPLFSGNWWRASDYEIRHGRIHPSRDATIESYDPWDAFHQRGELASWSPPFSSLIEMASGWSWRRSPRTGQLVCEPLGDPEKAEVIDWCRAHGLLGSLPHVVESVRIGRNLLRYLGGASWRAEVIAWSETDPPEDLSIRSVSREIEMYDDADLWRRCFRDFQSRGPLLQPDQQDFWRRYAEPLEWFIDDAITLSEGVRAVTAEGKPTVEGVDILNALASDISISLDVTTGVPVRRTNAKSLIAQFALMAIDSAVGQRLVECASESCFEIFATTRKNQRFHSRRCQMRELMKKNRDEGETEG